MPKILATVNSIKLEPGETISIMIGEEQIDVRLDKDGSVDVYSDFPTKKWSSWKPHYTAKNTKQHIQEKAVTSPTPLMKTDSAEDEFFKKRGRPKKEK